VQLHPPKPPPVGGSHCLGYHLAGASWWVGGRGHRKGQLRVLGSPSALRTKEPRTRGAPGGGVDPIFFRKPLGYHLGRAGGWQGPPEGPTVRARQPFRAPHQGTQDWGLGDHRGGGESVDLIVFWRKPLDTHLGVLKPACGPPGPIGNILASTAPASCRLRQQEKSGQRQEKFVDFLECNGRGSCELFLERNRFFAGPRRRKPDWLNPQKVCQSSW
jgi:hypothetical protein